LLNASLTVVERLSNSHQKIWQPFITKFLENFSKENPNVVYILMGKEAEKVKTTIEKGIFIVTPHPSPLARGAFFGTKPFSRANAELAKLGKPTVDWSRL